jgi:hypothetical protein
LRECFLNLLVIDANIIDRITPQTKSSLIISRALKKSFRIKGREKCVITYALSTRTRGISIIEAIS